MIRILLFAFAIFGANNIAHASFGGNEMSFEELMRVCVDEGGKNHFNTCLANGFNYETLETSLTTDQGEQITFTTKTILLGADILKQSQSDFVLQCTDCSGKSAYQVSTEIDGKLKSAFQSATNNYTFRTTRTQRNGRATSEAPQQNNGGEFLEHIHKVSETAQIWTDIWLKFWHSEDNSGLILVMNATETRPESIIKMTGNGSAKVIADLNRVTHGSDGSKSFTASVPSDSTQDYLDFIANTIAGGIMGERCETHWTGSNEDLVAQTVCYY